MYYMCGSSVIILHMCCCWQVLDMCAAPGSKTAQLIEFLHAEGSTETTVPSECSYPET